MRRFALDDSWWTIAVFDTLVRIAWGRPERPEQRHDRTLASHEAALAYAEMQIDKQRERGYVEVAPVAKAEPPAAELPEEPVDHRPRARSIRFEIAGEAKTSYRRYPKPARFVEYEQRDAELVEVAGELAAPDESRRKTERFASIGEASEAYDEAVQSLREDGWRQVHSSELAEARVHPELEAQCWAAPDDPGPWAVYADWLQTQGDPLGEIAARPAEARLVDTQLEHLGLEPEHVTFEREHGFPRRATIKYAADIDGDPAELARIAKAVVGSSVGRFVDRLRFGLAAYSDANDWSHTLRALAETPQAARIRELRFDAYEYTDCEISWATMGDLSGLFAPFPALEVLHLKSGEGGTLGELDLPSLRTFVRESGGLADAEIDSIVNARWPQLEHLEIWFGSPAYGADSTVASIRQILDGKGLPRLRHLGIVNCAWVEDAVDALVGSRILPQLHSLDLSKGILARRGVALLREHAAAFRHLASIDLAENLLTPDEAAQLREVLDNVIVCDQREREDYEADEAEGELERYVAVGE